MAPFGDADSSLKAQLESRGFSVFVLPVERKDWFNVARALFTFGFWSTSLTTDPGYTWYLDRLAEAVDRARLHSGQDQVRRGACRMYAFQAGGVTYGLSRVMKQ